MVSDQLNELVHATWNFLLADASPATIRIVGLNKHATTRDGFSTDDALTNEYDVITGLNDRFALCES